MFQHRRTKYWLLGIFGVGFLWVMNWQVSTLLFPEKQYLAVAEIEINDNNVIDFSTDIAFQSGMSTPWMTIAFNPAIEEEIRKGWGHDAESVRILTSMSQEANAFERLNKAMGELINLDLDKAGEILKRYRITYHLDSKTQIGYLSND